jgi:hypothetical protein
VRSSERDEALVDSTNVGKPTEDGEFLRGISAGRI